MVNRVITVCLTLGYPWQFALTFSISEGILLSLITFVMIRLCCGRYKELNTGMCILAVLFILKYIFL